MKVKFKDLAKGARFKYPDSDQTWVVLEEYRNGLVAEWTGYRATNRQSLCSFVDDEWTLESEVEVIDDTDLACRIQELESSLRDAKLFANWVECLGRTDCEIYKHELKASADLSIERINKVLGDFS